ncbi:hypothetical protein [Solimonas terrae]|uniref:Uncharacterized protein n=1 Tax=Solimonas terrae TaxID=1396819 RepID=A0A6M2BX89_9GAMM|nr:hypothetical protein [Solimonas terrae]NGY06753.1 hypothetical protein [Solimonas terrae]
MTTANWKQLTLGIASAVIALPLIGNAATGEPAASATTGSIVLDPGIARGANDCIRLDARHRPMQDSMSDVTPMLSNHCDYAVTVSYCIADDGAEIRACDRVAQRRTRAVPAHGSIRVPTDDQLLAGKDNDWGVNWIACRALPGGSTQFNADGTGGQCLSAGDTLQASAESSK